MRVLTWLGSRAVDVIVWTGVAVLVGGGLVSLLVSGVRGDSGAAGGVVCELCLDAQKQKEIEAGLDADPEPGPLGKQEGLSR